ncbi:hypothetical protein [Nodularia sp. UHCC 0506]|uniref:hypothetical protein n=1 Tax=Nodularia sp. UHCC 0506 TaxID=3110243 RepID=UPI002B20D549|nr:hypothetical protein [Nodularia sp. UHCC 0506]MEA5515128.1 hypothetical protein [Nodularia sp. UHCC 0506]
MISDFEAPPKNLSLLASVGGVVTAAIAIAGLNWWSAHLKLTQTNSLDTPKTISELSSLAKEAKHRLQQ